MRWYKMDEELDTLFSEYKEMVELIIYKAKKYNDTNFLDIPISNIEMTISRARANADDVNYLNMLNGMLDELKDAKTQMSNMGHLR